MPILQLVGRSANDCLHSDGKVLELLLGLTPVRTINHLVQARVHDGSLFIFLKDPQDQRPHNAHWAHPSGTRESWSWKMRNTCLAFGTMSPLERNKVRLLGNIILFFIFMKFQLCAKTDHFWD